MMTTNEQRNSDSIGEQGVNADVDDLYDVLADPHRRFIITCLDSHPEPMAMADVADELARWECEPSEDDIPKEQVDSHYIALHHVHVPKMVDAGILEYDADRKTIALVDECDGILPQGLPAAE